MADKTEAKQHLLFLDGLRGMAALFVVMHHTVLQFYDLDFHGLTGIRKALVRFLWEGHLAVDLFIVLSGFCLMLPVISADYRLKGGTFRFYKKRAVRILPPYYFTNVLCLLLIAFWVGNKTGTHWDISIPVTYKDVMLHLLLVHDFLLNHTARINHVMWSVSVEFRIYLFFPLLVWLYRKYAAGSTLLFAILVAAAGFFILYLLHKVIPDVNMLTSGVSPYIILFTFGMLAADFSFSPKQHHPTLRIVFPLVCVALLVLYIALRRIFAISVAGSFSFMYIFTDLIFGLWCAFLLVNLSVYNKSGLFKGLFKFLEAKPIAFLGLFAFSIYLIHAPLLQGLTQLLFKLNIQDRFTNMLILMFAGIPIIIALSYLFFLVCEKPFISLSKAKKEKVASEPGLPRTELT